MKSHLRAIIIAALTLGLLALFFRHADFGSVWAAMREADRGLLLLALATTVPLYIVRAWRWQYFLAPIGPTRFSVALATTIIGFAATSVLPARAGEVLRPYLLARREGLSATAAFATIVVERLMDLITVLLLFAAFVLVFDPGMALVDDRVYRAVKLGGLAAAAASLVALVFMIVIAGHPERVSRVPAFFDRVLPSRFAGVLTRLTRTFAEGLAVMRRPRDLAVALALSFPIWLTIAAESWLVVRAFDLTMPFTGSFLLTALLVVGVAVPTPGAVGGFHEAFRIGMTTFYGAPNDSAVGAAIVLHAVSFVPVTIVGIALMAREGLSFAGLQRMSGGASGSDAGEPSVGGEEPQRRAREAGVADRHEQGAATGRPLNKEGRA